MDEKERLISDLSREIDYLNKRLQYEYDRGYKEGYTKGHSEGIIPLIEYEKLRVPKYIIVTEENYKRIKEQGILED